MSNELIKIDKSSEPKLSAAAISKQHIPEKLDIYLMGEHKQISEFLSSLGLKPEDQKAEFKFSLASKFNNNSINLTLINGPVPTQGQSVTPSLFFEFHNRNNKSISSRENNFLIDELETSQIESIRFFNASETNHVCSASNQPRKILDQSLDIYLIFNQHRKQILETFKYLDALLVSEFFHKELPHNLNELNQLKIIINKNMRAFPDNEHYPELIKKVAKLELKLLHSLISANDNRIKLDDYIKFTRDFFTPALWSIAKVEHSKEHIDLLELYQHLETLYKKLPAKSFFRFLDNEKSEAAKMLIKQVQQQVQNLVQDSKNAQSNTIARFVA